MAFSLWTRPVRGTRPARPARPRLRADRLEDRCTPSAALFTTNAGLSASGNGTGDTILALSRNGRFAVVSSTSTDLVTGQVDSPGTPDLFWFDTASGQRKLITAKTGTTGQALGTAGTQAVISADGQFVAFLSRSQASFLDPTIPAAGDAGSFTDDVFRWSAATGTSTLMSKETATKAFGATVPSANPAISADGQVVAFTSTRNAAAVTKTVMDNGDLSVDIFGFGAGLVTAQLVSFANAAEAVGLYTLGGTTTLVNNVQVDPFGRYMDAAGRAFTFVTGMSPDKLGTGLLPYAATTKLARDVYLATFATAGAFGGTGPTVQLVSSVAADVTRAIGVSNGRASNAVIAPDNPSVVVFTATTASGKLNELVPGYLNNNAGRDHNPGLWSVLIAGGNVVGGQVYGKTSEGADSIVENPVSTGDLFATIYAALGFDKDAQIRDNLGRPSPLAGEKAKPVTALLKNA